MKNVLIILSGHESVGLFKITLYKTTSSLYVISPVE